MIISLLADLVVALGSSLDSGPRSPGEGPDFPFTYLRGHPSFPTPQLPVSGPYRIVVGRDRLLYAGERRQKPMFQIPNELIRSIRGKSDEQLTIRVGGDDDWVDIDFRATGLLKKRDMQRLMSAVRKRTASSSHPISA
ncbi:MAG: hypothetical protein ACRD1T_04820 [Acidimicrobiia bacterium]